jgi:hypothetical protein
MRMLKVGDNARFLLETLYKLLALRELTGEYLDRHIAIHRGLVGFVDVCHSAFAYLIDDAIRTEHLPGLNSIHVTLLFDLHILRHFIPHSNYIGRIKSVLYSRRFNRSKIFGNCFETPPVIPGRCEHGPLNVASGFFVGKADLQREALIGKKKFNGVIEPFL